MGYEFPSRGLPETQIPTEDIESLFKDGRNSLYMLTEDPEFQKFYTRRGILSGEAYGPAYWAAAADFARQTRNMASEAGEDPKELAIRELFAATADAVYKQVESDISGKIPFTTRQRLCHYNQLIRTVVQDHPDLRASELEGQLIKVANMTVDDLGTKGKSSNIIHGKVVGMQHEMAFAQILAKTGRKFRPATAEEDLSGTDYVTESNTGNPLNIDVKASIRKIKQNNDSNQLYWVNASGTLITHSLMTNDELNDRFSISEEVASQRADYFNHEIMERIDAHRATESLVSP